LSPALAACSASGDNASDGSVHGVLKGLRDQLGKLSCAWPTYFLPWRKQFVQFLLLVLALLTVCGGVTCSASGGWRPAAA